MTEYYNNTLCIQAGWLLDRGVFSPAQYRHLTTCRRRDVRPELTVLRRGCKGTPALVEWRSIPDRFKNIAIAMLGGDPAEVTAPKLFKQHMVIDPAAMEFYSHYVLPTGRTLSADKIKEYTHTASALNTLVFFANNRRAFVKALGGNAPRDVWAKLSELLAEVQADYSFKLPFASERLRDKASAYKKDGYASLVSAKFGNSNSRKVTALIERLLLSIYCLPNKPFVHQVHSYYLQFLGGAIEVVDVQTGECFNRATFTTPEGEPLYIAESTVWNIINAPKNRVLVDKYRLDGLDYNNTHRPHHHRHRPLFSFSKISMDDRDLPRKLHNGNRVKAYYAYDLASGAVVGASYSRDKDINLIYACFRNMFRFINANKWGMPLEVEVEHHLMNTIEDKLNDMFAFVRFCNPGNSQEKGAEHMNKAKKYGVEKNNHNGIGRWWARSEAYRVKTTKVKDEYKEISFDYDRLVADDRADIQEYNNAPHPNQKLYKGLTRLEVLTMNINPDVLPVNQPVLLYAIGERSDTSVRRSQYVRVQYNNYQLSHPAIIGRLLPNNYDVQAYYLPNEAGEINEVHLYQNGHYIDTCAKLLNYNEAKAEQTDEDTEIMEQQRAYVSQYDKMVRAGAGDIAGKVAVVKNSQVTVIAHAEAPPAANIEVPEETIDDLLKNSFGEDYAARALHSM